MLSLVLTTVKGRADARKLAEKLVSERLAACVSVVPNVTSIYRWRGKTERAREVMVVMKTTAEKTDRLVKRIKELHGYDVPEVIVLKVERGLPGYLRWVEESLKP